MIAGSFKKCYLQIFRLQIIHIQYENGERWKNERLSEDDFYLLNYLSMFNVSVFKPTSGRVNYHMKPKKKDKKNSVGNVLFHICVM